VRVAGTLEKQLWLIRVQLPGAGQALAPRGPDSNRAERP
jgi:hypothetical protein